MSAPQPTPGPDLTREYIISRGDLLTERNQLAAEVQRLRAERDALRAALADLVASLSEQYNAGGLTGFAVIRDYHAAVAALHAARAALNQ